MWGYHRYDGDGVDAGHQGAAQWYPASYCAIGAHFSARNIHILNNVMYDSSTAFNSGSDGPRSGFRKGLIDGRVENNIFYDCGQFGRPVMEISSNLDTTFDNNYWVDNTNKEGITHANTGSFVGNKVANPYNESITFEVTAGQTEYGAIAAGIATTTEVSNDTWDDYVYTWGKFTNKPQQITLPKVIAPGKEFPKWN